MSENTLGAFMEEELVSQPEVWQRAVDQARTEQLLPADGKRIASSAVAHRVHGPELRRCPRIRR